MKKIMFLLDSLGGGGFERRMTQLILGLSEDKDYADVYVLLPKNARVIRKEALQYNCQYIFYNGRFDIIKKLYEVTPDIVHCCSPVNSFFVNIYKAFYKCKYVAGFIADANRPSVFSKKNIGLLFSYFFSDAVVGNSKAGIIAYRCPLNKSFVIYNGFDPKRLEIDMADDLAEIRKRSKVIISMVAALRDDKDYKSYVDTAKSMSDNHEVLFLIAGLGPNEEKIKEYCKINAINNVMFLGYRMDVINVFKISDISVLLSNQERHKEGVSNSILESMAVGTPVIATTGGGTNEIIRNGVDGIIIDDNRTETVRAALTKLIYNTELKKSMSQSGEQRILNDFSLITMVNNYKNLYNSL